VSAVRSQHILASRAQQTRDFTAAKARLLRDYLETLNAYEGGF
jgi:hypothetical protein